MYLWLQSPHLKPEPHYPTRWKQWLPHSSLALEMAMVLCHGNHNWEVSGIHERFRAGSRKHFKLSEINLKCDDIFITTKASKQQGTNWLDNQLRFCVNVTFFPQMCFIGNAVGDLDYNVCKYIALYYTPTIDFETNALYNHNHHHCLP